jgi:acetoin utilization deacetylase AcuC-like enzyme
MRVFYHPDHVRHDPAQLHKPGRTHRNLYFSEVAQRGELIHQALQSASIGPIMPPEDFSIEPIGEVHEYGMLNLFQTAHEQMEREEVGQQTIARTFNLRRDRSPHKPLSVWGLLGYYSFDVSCPIFADTWDVAYWSAQTALSAAAVVAAGEEEISYALCRPPGHHASADLFGGFCYLNNTAIAANWLVRQGQRVAILDVDYHHGNGTQSIFYNSPEVLVCSIHADPLNEYPYYWGYADEFGAGAGKNYNFNYPLALNATEREYLKVFNEAMARIQLFVPNTLLISFGADIMPDDPIAGFRLDQTILERIGSDIRQLALPTVAIQEGGYALASLGEYVVTFLKALEGQ